MHCIKMDLIYNEFKYVTKINAIEMIQFNSILYFSVIGYIYYIIIYIYT